MKQTPFIKFDHVQLAMPPGKEDTARDFYCRLLGMVELPKPPELAKRGGVWFASGSVQIHLGVESDFRPAKKAHPALVCEEYDSLCRALKLAAVDLREDHTIPGVRRCHLYDPFGNRIELVAG